MASIVFDLDETFIGNAPDIRNIAKRILSETGHKPILITKTHAFIGNGAGVFVQKICDSRPIFVGEHTSYLKSFLDLYEGVIDLIAQHSDAIDALISLKKKGHRLRIY